jgi:hypothetical protein
LEGAENWSIKYHLDFAEELTACRQWTWCIGTNHTIISWWVGRQRHQIELGSFKVRILNKAIRFYKSKGVCQGVSSRMYKQRCSDNRIGAQASRRAQAYISAYFAFHE